MHKKPLYSLKSPDFPFCSLHLARSRVGLTSQKEIELSGRVAMSIKIEIYTKLYCAYCERAKELLHIKGVNFVEYDITDDRIKAAEMQQRAQSQKVPGIFINDTPIGGCIELFDLNEKGDLDTLLGSSFSSNESF
jgi:glutaredoxin 3